MTMNPNDALRYALDPAAFMDAFSFPPDDWQRDFLRTRDDSLLLCSRQTGKSTVTAHLAVAEALFRPPALVLLLSPSLRQSAELFVKVEEVYTKAAAGMAMTKNRSALRVELSNGSRIISLPGKEETIRGYSGVSLLIIDEASRVDDPLYFSVRPMLAVSGGRLVALTTPFGKRGWFYTEWTEGGTRWHRARVTADQCPRITDEFLTAERSSMGDWWYRQEYFCEFVQTVDSVFGFDEVQKAISDDVKPLFVGG